VAAALATSSKLFMLCGAAEKGDRVSQLGNRTVAICALSEDLHDHISFARGLSHTWQHRSPCDSDGVAEVYLSVDNDVPSDKPP